jgi:Gamma-glutamyl cyclotransferase, AIG2-like
MIQKLLILLAVSFLLIASHALTIPYFAYGSNVYPPTMEKFRNIECIDSTAAILPGYKLRFNLPGMPGLEPSWACVQKNRSEMVHGVLYTLTPQDFARVSISEGVPFGYQWEKVDVYPYVGDGMEAGQTSLLTPKKKPAQAYTLVSRNPFLPSRDIPPSRAYLDLLIKGAMEYKMDEAHIDKLKSTPVGFAIGGGYVDKLV